MCSRSSGPSVRWNSLHSLQGTKSVLEVSVFLWKSGSGWCVCSQPTIANDVLCWFRTLGKDCSILCQLPLPFFSDRTAVTFEEVPVRLCSRTSCCQRSIYATKLGLLMNKLEPHSLDPELMPEKPPYRFNATWCERHRGRRGHCRSAQFLSILMVRIRLPPAGVCRDPSFHRRSWSYCPRGLEALSGIATPTSCSIDGSVNKARLAASGSR